MNHLEPLTEQQLVGICNLQHSSQQAEDALSQGMEALQQSLAEALSRSLGSSGSSGNVANYMGQMAIAMAKLETLGGFLHQVIFVLAHTHTQIYIIFLSCLCRWQSIMNFQVNLEFEFPCFKHRKFKFTFGRVHVCLLHLFRRNSPCSVRFDCKGVFIFLVHFLLYFVC